MELKSRKSASANHLNSSFLIFVVASIIFGFALLMNKSTQSVLASGGRLPNVEYQVQDGFPRSDSGSTIDFASPSVVDIDSDGKLEILTADSDGCVWAWNHDGTPSAGFPITTLGDCKQSGRINGPLAIGDVDGDYQLEIAAGTRGNSNQDGHRGKVFLWNSDGSLLSGWPQEMEWNHQFASSLAEVRSVVLANITGDKNLEIVASTTNNGSKAPDNNVDSRNLYAYSQDGKVLPGFPTWFNRAGIFGFVGTANLICDGYDEIIAGRDHNYVHAYGNDGQQINSIWPVKTYVDENNAEWNTDLFLEFTHNAPAMGDLDQDGVVEIVIAGKVRDPLQGRKTIQSGILVLEPNGQRRKGWEIAKLSDDILANSGFYPSQAPALADLDTDGELEIVLTLRDGTLRVYRENGALMWIYDFAQGHLLYGSEPVIGDINSDNKPDIVFGTYSPDGSAYSEARVIGLDAVGNLLPGFPISLTEEGSGGKQGIRAAPTLADLDGDGDVEIIIASWAGIIYVWDLPGKHQNNLMPWPTGRHDNYRSGYSGNFKSDLNIVENFGDIYSIFVHKLFLPIIFSNC